MLDTTSCPTCDELRRFVRGQCVASQTAHLAGHLANCTNCLDAVSALEPPDTLMEAMQAQAARTVDPERTAIEGIIDRLRRLHQGDSASPDETRDIRPASSLAATVDLSFAAPPSDASATNSGQHGHFSIVKAHAQGGLGLVSIARDEKLKRQVAIKEIRPERAQDPQLRQRFINEAEITGKLEHPGIVPIYALEEDSAGHPYYAMRFIQGRTLTAAIREHHARPTPLTLRALLQRFVSVCQTMAYAHSKGVIHRDLKPANIMLGEYGETLVVDWGLAKRVGGTSSDEPEAAHAAILQIDGQTAVPASDAGLTEAGQVLGTPGYMSPEQATRSVETGTPTDMYALGAILYEILCGLAPYRDAGTIVAILRLLLSAVPPQPPSELKSGVPRSLEAVCQKAMAHRPEDRYATPQELAGEIDRWLADEPVLCFRESRLAQLARWSRRHRTWVLSGAAAMSLVAAISTAAALLINQEKQHVVEEKEENARLAKLADDHRLQAEERGQKAQHEWDRAEDQLYFSQIKAAQSEWKAGDAHGAWQQLNACRMDRRGWEHDYLATLFNRNQRTLLGHQSSVTAVAFSPDGAKVASASVDGTLKIWDSATAQLTQTLKSPSDCIRCLAYSPDGRQIVSGGATGTLIAWDAETGKLHQEWPAHLNEVSCVGFSPGGQQIASGSKDGTVKLWDADTRQLRRTLETEAGEIRDLAFQPKGPWIVAASVSRSLVLWNTDTGKQIDPSFSHGASLCVAFSPDGNLVATGGWDRKIKLWNLPTDSNQLLPAMVFELLPRAKKHLVPAVRVFEGHHGIVMDVAFSPDGKQLVSGSDDRTIKLWDVATAAPIRTLQGHTDIVMGLAFSPGGKQIASGGYDGTIKLWDLAAPTGVPTLDGHIGGVSSVAVSPNGRRIASSAARNVKHWDATSRKDLSTSGFDWAVTEHPDRIVSIRFSPDGKYYCTGSWDKTLKIWSVESGRCECTLQGHTDHVTGLAYSPDGTRIASSSDDKTLKLWNAATGELLRTFTGHTEKASCVAFLPDGRRIVSGSHDQTLKIWDTESPREPHTCRDHESYVDCLAVSADGKHIVSGARNLTLKLWDAATGKLIRSLSGHSGAITCVAFTHDGRRIISGSTDLTLKIWDVATGQETLTLPAHEAKITDIAFAPKGNWFVTSSEDRTLKIWDASIRAAPATPK